MSPGLFAAVAAGRLEPDRRSSASFSRASSVGAEAWLIPLTRSLAGQAKSATDVGPAVSAVEEIANLVLDRALRSDLAGKTTWEGLVGD